MSAEKTGKKKKRNPNLRLVKSGEPMQRKRRRRREEKPEKLRFGKARRIGILTAVLFCLLLLVGGGFFYVVNNFKVTTVHVDGNVHYTNEEIMEMVMGGRFGDNSLFLSMKYRDRGIEGVPFVETMDVDIEARDTIRITVYEKALAGYVRYLGRCVYFDKDGIVVETSEEETAGIPQVTGLAFDHVVLHDVLPVDKPELFDEILNITQQLAKYDLAADRIYFDTAYQVTLYFGDARVALGENKDIDEKIMKLRYILPDLLGKSGTLDMREYSEDTKTYSFEQD
ncbi:MAG: cell division protein FtsQ/DivIB [Bacteroidales bacterium]|nr:cell division protein FtsQ/DivIB [Bacteroidales bacterium]MCM1416305.1 cell division protein FtsQ/DivIB [bacterium]MCM1424241.1 cell division protein FtsQ/DivIB [bacterium]